jgi:flagellar assembly factor FliW
MKFTTTRFGEIEFPEEVALSLPGGILGFPDDRRYILLEHNIESSPFRWLQSLDSPELAFIVVDPALVDPRYRIDLDRDSALCIGTSDPADCAIVAIVNVPRDNPIAMTANLKAPVVINAENRVGRQIVLSSNLFSLNAPVFPALGAGAQVRDAVEDEPVVHERRAASA